jgi:hypothetical protein
VVKRGNLRREMRMKMSCGRVIDPALPAKDLSEFAQGFADEVAGGERGVQAGEGFLRLGRFVTEGEKGEEGVLRISG